MEIVITFFGSHWNHKHFQSFLITPNFPCFASRCTVSAHASLEDWLLIVTSCCIVSLSAALSQSTGNPPEGSESMTSPTIGPPMYSRSYAMFHTNDTTQRGTSYVLQLATVLKSLQNRKTGRETRKTKLRTCSPNRDRNIQQCRKVASYLSTSYSFISLSETIFTGVIANIIT